jgi:diguanylate cyclase (GGDEF)-like protein
MTDPAGLADQLLSAAGDIAYDWDVLTDDIRWFGAWQRIFESGSPPPDSQALFLLIHPDDRGVVFNGEGGVTIDRQFRLTQESGGVLWIHERGTIQNSGPNTAFQRGIWRIIDQPAQASAPVEAQNRDALTGCYKRRVLQMQLAKAIDSARSARRLGAYLVVGVDKMSFVNEAVGTEAGDAVLRGVATRLGQVLPPRATLGRVGGDVFGILLPEPLGGDINAIAERILKDFRNSPIIAAHVPIHITVSIGGVRVPSVAKSSNDAMIYAEQALHMARQRGRNTFVEYIDSPERALENRQQLELSERIKQAFKHDGFRLAYQPIVDCAGKAIMYEALVRMFDEDNKPIPAALFVPMIEQMGMAVELDKLVLNLAIREMTKDPGLCLAVNVSGLTASNADWPDYLNRILGERPDIAGRLVVEITETAAIADIGETKRFVAALRALGGRISMDDFGAGATSIRYLRELSLSIMKIDKDLLREVTTNKEQQHLVSILIELAHGLDIRTVAEGVETAEMADWLRRAKVDYMQGYYFGKPAFDIPPTPAAASEALLPPVPILGAPAVAAY